ncbi:hypothetical protein [Kocuria sediminis]|nr:hypothetical protein [Kocuria sediminis]
MSAENPSGDDREQEPNPGEARVQQLTAKTLERYERLLRRLAKE